ncbi:hypothetical protein FXV83_38470 [Bradyrhizobium hipponense]|uniref:Uncharacterized protein n=2 Tax=Bradyrhizobium hipponense TaxID=2605638 RepID=A0A5S4YAF6_9BRAD|nr:hypothetical protein FXV83_38470 [Bradyrhizobium hipponense]
MQMLITHPDVIKLALKPYLGRLRRIERDSGLSSTCVHPNLPKFGLSAISLGTLHVCSATSAQCNKNGKIDVLGIA